MNDITASAPLFRDHTLRQAGPCTWVGSSEGALLPQSNTGISAQASVLLSNLHFKEHAQHRAESTRPRGDLCGLW